MISFRYHLVTIVSVFLALAVGVLLGGTVFDTGLANTLDLQVRQLQQSVNQYRTTIADLERKAAQWQQYGDQTLAALIANRLDGRSVVIVTDQAVDPSTFAAAQQSLKGAGASIVAVVQVNAKMALTNASDRQELAQTLNLSPAAEAAALSTQAAQVLAGRLAAAPGTGAPDPLDELWRAGFVTVFDLVSQAQGGLSAVGAAGQAVAIIAGGPNPPAVPPDAFLMPLAQSLADTSPQVPVVAGEPADATSPLVSLIRASGADGRLGTVDDLDQVFGRAAMVLSLERLISNPGQGGDYGLQSGADLLPPL